MGMLDLTVRYTRELTDPDVPRTDASPNSHVFGPWKNGCRSVPPVEGVFLGSSPSSE